MVNKSLLALLAVGLVAVFGVGVLVGTQVDGPSLYEPSTAGGPTQTPTDGTAGGPTTPTPTPEPTAETPASVPASSFNESAIAAALVTRINEARAERNATQLSTVGKTAGTLEAMAKNHSDAMAAAGEVNHTIDGRDSYDRYEANDLADQCSFARAGATVESPTLDRFEAVGHTVAGQPYGGEFNANDTAVAQALADDWLSTLPYSQRLTLDGAERVGVGVTVTEAGDVYATVNICG